MGHQLAHDLRVVDSGPIGIRHQGVACGHCATADFFGIRWKCSRCPQMNLCTACYMADAHDTTHAFRRFDAEDCSGHYVVPPRRNARRVTLRGIFVGAKVVRSGDWVWENQDGGKGSQGQVKDLWIVSGDTFRTSLYSLYAICTIRVSKDKG